MAFSFNWKPQKIPTQLKGQANLPEIEQPFDFNSYFTNLVNREEMEGYHPAQNFSVPNQQHGGNQAVNYAGYSPTTPMTEEDVINQNMAERQAGNADDMANWIQQGGTPQADAAAAAQAQAEQEAAAKQEQIADIQSQIKALETRIAQNKSKLQNWSGNANQIAAIEARKINSQDPTMIWRWKSQLDENRRLANAQGNGSNDAAKANAAYEIQNDLDSIIVDAKMDSATRNAHLSKLANLKTLAQKNGLPTDSIDKRIKEVKGEGGEQTSREKAKTDWKGLKGKPDLTSKEIQTALDNPDMNWDPDERKEAENLRDKLKKHEAATQSVKDMKADYKRRTGQDFDKADPIIQKHEQERWKRRNKK